MPAVVAGGLPETAFHLIRLPRANRMQPALQGFIRVVGMDQPGPFPAHKFPYSQPGVILPLLV